MTSSPSPDFEDSAVMQALRGLTDDLRAANEQLLIASVRDQESAANAEEGRAQLNALVEALSEGVAIADTSGRFVMMNRAACAILGVAEWSLLSTNDSDGLNVYDKAGAILPSDKRPVARALRGEHFDDAELVIVTADGEKRDLLASGTSITDGLKVLLAIVVFRDLTEVRRLERERDEYLMLISHDIRGPLSAILMLSESLKGMATNEGLRDEVVDRVARIARNATKINSLVSDLLESAGVGHSPASRAPVALGTLLHGAIDLLADQSRGRVHFDDAGGPSCTVDADRVQIERAVSNLLSNALKYSSRTVLLRLGRAGEFAVVDVVDSGVGLSTEDVARVFDRYYRAPTGQRMSDGFGLGLYITRLIAEAHGGRVEVRSVLGEGSTFSLVLPLQALVAR